MVKWALIVLLVALMGVACICCGCVDKPEVQLASPQGQVNVTTTQPVDVNQELSAIKAQVTGIENHNQNANSCDYVDMRMRTAGMAVFAFMALIFARNTVPPWAQKIIVKAQ